MKEPAVAESKAEVKPEVKAEEKAEVKTEAPRRGRTVISKAPVATRAAAEEDPFRHAVVPDSPDFLHADSLGADFPEDELGADFPDD